jgi:thiamine biosynthesis lipoprotein
MGESTTAVKARRILHHEEPVMGTIVTFDLYDDQAPTQELRDLLHGAIDVLHEADGVFSTYKEGSAVSRLRRGDLALDHCPRSLRDVLELCEVAKSLTHGWFDPWALPGGVDPTGYVKGWAAQRALDELRPSGICGALVNAAGDTATFGGPQLGAPFRIGIVDPRATKRLAWVVESPGAVATSGLYERGEHLIDPHTGEAVSRVASATVTGPDLGLADALATALAVAGSQGLPLIEAIEDYEALIIGFDGDFKTTGGFSSARM